MKSKKEQQKRKERTGWEFHAVEPKKKKKKRLIAALFAPISIISAYYPPFVEA